MLKSTKLLLLFLASLLATSAFAQRAQIIHNVPVEGLETVSVWINGEEFLPEFSYLDATPFRDLPDAEGNNYLLEIKAVGASAQDDAVLSFEGVVDEGQSVYVIASGVAPLEDYDSEANGDAIAANLYVLDAAEEADMGMTMLAGFHGATDVVSVEPYLTDFEVYPFDGPMNYGELTDYFDAPSELHLVEIRSERADDATLLSVWVDLSELGGQSALVMPTGFAQPSQNMDGPPLNVVVIGADGSVAFTMPPTTNAQIVHNSADPRLSSIDVEVVFPTIPQLTLGRVETDFGFREATETVMLPALAPVIAVIYEAGTDNVLAEIDVPLLAPSRPDEGVETNHVIFVNGVAEYEEGDFEPNPDGVSIDLGVFAYEPARFEAEEQGMNMVDVLAFHGSTDAPAVDVGVVGSDERLVSGLQYGDYSDGYLSLDAQDYALGVYPAGADEPLLRYLAPLSGFADQAGVLFASGFLNTEEGQNLDGLGFGLFWLTSEGEVARLPLIGGDADTAFVQLIHNAPDPALESVDVVIESDETGATLVEADGVAFRTGTGFIPVDLEQLPVSIYFYLPDDEEPTAEFTFEELEAGTRYVVVANGVLNPAQFQANPDDEDISFGLFSFAPAEELAGESSDVDLLIHHGAPNAPAVDIFADGAVALAEGLQYGDYSEGYQTVVQPLEPVSVEVRAAGETDALVTYEVPLQDFIGKALTVFASGFLPSEENPEGAPAFGLYGMPAEGGPALMFEPVSRAELNKLVAGSYSVYPNPAHTSATVAYELVETAAVSYTLKNLAGQTVQTRSVGAQAPGLHRWETNVAQLPAGVYLYQINAGGDSVNGKLIIAR